MNKYRLGKGFMNACRTAAVVLTVMFFDHTVHATVYQEPVAFIEEVFAGKPPAPATLWLDDAVQAEIVGILGHRYPAMRLRHWSKGPRSAWVLEEIGKEEPIIVGIVVNRCRIERVKVLEFRESRGEEVRYPFFTKQFEGAGSGQDRQLDRHIDGISGATLSARALTRLARLALYLDGMARAPR
jgi:hypothetical protein